MHIAREPQPLQSALAGPLDIARADAGARGEKPNNTLDPVLKALLGKDAAAATFLRPALRLPRPPHADSRNGGNPARPFGDVWG